MICINFCTHIISKICHDTRVIICSFVHNIILRRDILNEFYYNFHTKSIYLNLIITVLVSIIGLTD